MDSLNNFLVISSLAFFVYFVVEFEGDSSYLPQCTIQLFAIQFLYFPVLEEGNWSFFIFFIVYSIILKRSAEFISPNVDYAFFLHQFVPFFHCPCQRDHQSLCIDCVS
jgi:hypothetical protein